MREKPLVKYILAEIIAGGAAESSLWRTNLSGLAQFLNHFRLKRINMHTVVSQSGINLLGCCLCSSSQFIGNRALIGFQLYVYYFAGLSIRAGIVPDGEAAAPAMCSALTTSACAGGSYSSRWKLDIMHCFKICWGGLGPLNFW